MRFLDLYESDEQNNGKITIDTILNDLNNFHSDRKARIAFLNKINRPGRQADVAFTYGGDKNGEGGKSVSFTADVGSNQPSDDFSKIMHKIKDDHASWKKDIEEVINDVDNSNRQQYIKTYFIPKLENPGAKITTTGKLKGDYRVPGEEHYKKFGKAMVFYCGKCVSKLTDADTKIGPDKFKEIMQGCFGAAPDNNHEDAAFLDQFKDLESKMKIDAAKNVIKSIHTAGTKDIEGLNPEEYESYYSGMSFLIKNKLFEADESDEKQQKGYIECPKTIDEFSDNVGTALKQAKAVAEKYPKQYKLWYEQLRAAFDEGVEEYQKLERDPETKEIENPITGEKEHRHGKAWGAGGPNAFIRDNPDLKAITDKIRQGTPGCEGVNGWDIFNCGPKLILTMFDALEKGGKIYQKLCDDLGEGMRQIKRSLGTTKPADFDKLIKKYNSENEHGKAMEVGLSGILLSLANLYKILANGKIGQINYKTKTFNSENNGSETVIQTRIDDLKKALLSVTKEKPEYDKWCEEENKKRQEHIKQLETEIAGLAKQKDQPAEGQSNEQGKDEPKKDGISIKKDSYVKKFSIKDILNEEEEKKEETKNQQKVTKVEDELKKKKEELEKLKSGKNDKTLLNLENYVAILGDYKEVLGLEPYIKEAYEAIGILFNPDAAEEQYQEIFNKTKKEEETSDNEEETTVHGEKLSLSSRLDNILKEYKLFEEEGETVDPDEMDDADVKADAPKKETPKEETPKKETSDKQENEPEVKSQNEGNLDWTKRDQAQGLKGVYRVFAEGKDDVRFDLSVFKDLAKAKTAKEALKKVYQIVENLQKTVTNLKYVEPIVDGIVACNKIDDPSTIPGCIETINIESAKKEEEQKSDNAEEKKEDKTEQKSKKDVYTEYRDNLAKMIDESSPLMKNIVANLNSKIADAKDDSWIKEYQEFVNAFNAEGKKILDYLHTIYKGSEGGEKWLAEKEKQLANCNFIVKIWLIVSMAKYCGEMLSDQIDKEEEDELKREQEGQTQNASYKPESNQPKLNEAEATKHTINVLLNTVRQNGEKLNFNALLPLDYKNEIYNLKNADKFNENEQNFANAISIKNIRTGNGIYAILSHIIGGDVNTNPILTAIKEKNINCQECVKRLTYLHTAKDNKTEPDRNIYFIYGLIKALCTSLSNLDDKTKEIDMRNDVYTKKGDAESGSSGTAAQDKAEDVAQKGAEEGQKKEEDKEKVDKNSYIPEISTGTLMNEIYKYIRGN